MYFCKIFEGGILIRNRSTTLLQINKYLKTTQESNIEGLHYSFLSKTSKIGIQTNLYHYFLYGDLL